MTQYTQWTDERLERGIEKFEQVIQDDVDHFLEAIRYDVGILFQMCAERSHRQDKSLHSFKRRYLSTRSLHCRKRHILGE